jgi:hypothetical protein
MFVRAFPNLLRAVGIVAVVAGLSGCYVQVPPTRVERVDIAITQAPPPDIAETPTRTPNADSYWVPGHWVWNGNTYSWRDGHWVQSRPDFVFVRAYWTNNGGYWVYHPGRWERVGTPPPEYREVVAPEPPPPPRVEVVGVAPGAGYFWVPGYWRWGPRGYLWVGGAWNPHRAGHYWVHPHWTQVGVSFRFRGGYWRRH